MEMAIDGQLLTCLLLHQAAKVIYICAKRLVFFPQLSNQAVMLCVLFRVLGKLLILTSILFHILRNLFVLLSIMLYVGRDHLCVFLIGLRMLLQQFILLDIMLIALI